MIPVAGRAFCKTIFTEYSPEEGALYTSISLSAKSMHTREISITLCNCNCSKLLKIAEGMHYCDFIDLEGTRTVIAMKTNSKTPNTVTVIPK